MVTSIGRYIGMLTSQKAEIVSVAVTIGVFSIILLIGKDYFMKYHDLVEVAQSDRTEMGGPRF
ncbi:hypothetical protein GPL15_13275 [Clostridium sp. MCC353]|uniref:hypothetical protein n=1 Tax=Clostridium sp. MCC353 TaxID=2592646 RepID=UPI001C0366A1|nr:hypothetical protein [Clostridium sp. MCC353]MBT9777476.1 hypothetical protein [Clostridium sp. MCC353]